MLREAPFHADVAGAPAPDRSLWLRAADGVLLRAGFWRASGEEKGTVLIFPGRTEYVEKYAHTAAELAARGYASVAIDWRGQGLAERPLADRNVGHVNNFLDYQRDLQAVLGAVRVLGLPRPFYMIAHSMGGAIGLRSLHEGLGVKAAVFSAPMWGIAMAPHMRPLAWVLGFSGREFGFGHRYVPGGGPVTYTAEAPFADNVLTTDPAMFAQMTRQVTTHPELALGSPSLHWLHAALSECAILARRPAPRLPALCFVGSNERVVSVPAIEKRMAAWPDGRLERVQGAEHEIMEELPASRKRFFDAADALFSAQRQAS